MTKDTVVYLAVVAAFPIVAGVGALAINWWSRHDFRFPSLGWRR